MVIRMGLETIIRAYETKRRVDKSVKSVEKSRKKAIVARSKRVGVEFRIKSKQTIGGKVFYAYDWEKTKTAANNLANTIRRDGDLARVVSLNKGYAVYMHPN